MSVIDVWLERFNQRMAKAIDAKFNTGNVWKDIGRTVAFACVAFAVVALMWAVR